MRISELAARAQITPDTIRFYEKMGLLDETHFTRLANNYRDYNESACTRLELIRHGQAAGFRLSEMAGGLRRWETDEITLEQKENYFMQRLEQVDAQIAKLYEMRTYIEDKLAMIREHREQEGEYFPV